MLLAWSDENKKRIKILLVEMFSVILAVLLALAANNWQDERKAKQLTVDSLSYIKQEIMANREKVIDSLEFHEALYKKLNSALSPEGSIENNKAKILLQDMYQNGMMRPAAVVDTAWKTATISGAIRGMSYQTIMQISLSYSQQEKYFQLIRSSRDTVTKVSFMEVSPEREFIGNYEIVNSYMWADKYLLKLYDETLKYLANPELPNK